MSDEQRKDDETEVEGHGNRAGVTEEPALDGETEVEGHRVTEELVDDDENEVEAHIRSYPSARMD
jgi:hypothetical protein